MYDLTQQKTTFGGEPKAVTGDEVHLVGRFRLTQYNIPHRKSQPPIFDANLSLRIDHAVARADAAHLGACDAWALCRHAAGEAVRLADLRDATLAEVIRLEALMPDPALVETSVSETVEMTDERANR